MYYNQYAKKRLNPLLYIKSILIEFDDRYNALSSKQFNRYPSVDFVTVPLYAHVSEKPTSTAWISTKQYDEKFIIHQ